jgi:hypothetical protein
MALAYLAGPPPAGFGRDAIDRRLNTEGLDRRSGSFGLEPRDWVITRAAWTLKWVALDRLCRLDRFLRT